uniref:Uncharacterized protein n=1 Tax=Ursus maritimus TaxID=29073 RepID=A0A452UPM2_URSMA
MNKPQRALLLKDKCCGTTHLPGLREGCRHSAWELWKRDVVWDKGGKSRAKLVKLLASSTAEDILENLKQQVEKTTKKHAMREVF